MTSYFDHFLVISILSVYISNSSMVLLCVMMVYILMNYYNYIVPNRFQAMIEMMFEHWFIVIKDNLNEGTNYYVLPLVSLFMFLLGMNMLGFLIYIFPLTTHMLLTFGVAFGTWVGIMLLGLQNFKLTFFSVFMPSNSPLILSPLLVPIEMMSSISSPMALGLRLAANLTAGHMLLAILADFNCKLLFYSFGLINLFPMFMMMFMTVLEVGVLIIQAYVFCLLLTIYLKDSVMLH